MVRLQLGQKHFVFIVRLDRACKDLRFYTGLRVGVKNIGGHASHVPIERHIAANHLRTLFGYLFSHLHGNHSGDIRNEDNGLHVGGGTGAGKFNNPGNGGCTFACE